MDHRVWDQRYAATEPVWTAGPNRFLVAEVDSMAPAGPRRHAPRGRPRHHQPHPRLRRAPRPGVLYSPDQIVSSLGGLVIDKAERVQRPVETDERTVVAIDTLVRADLTRPPATV
jgi:hypothetical protein